MKKLIIIFVISITGIIQMFSQKESVIFNYVLRSDLQIPDTQSEKADRMIANPVYSEYYFVEINDIKEVQQ